MTTLKSLYIPHMLPVDVVSLRKLLWDFFLCRTLCKSWPEDLLSHCNNLLGSATEKAIPHLLEHNVVDIVTFRQDRALSDMMCDKLTMK